jgi:hypothetical protein
MEKRMKIQVLIHPAEDGGYWAEAPALQGCYSEGETIDEAIKIHRGKHSNPRDFGSKG